NKQTNSKHAKIRPNRLSFFHRRTSIYRTPGEMLLPRRSFLASSNTYRSTSRSSRCLVLLFSRPASASSARERGARDRGEREHGPPPSFRAGAGAAGAADGADAAGRGNRHRCPRTAFRPACRAGRGAGRAVGGVDRRGCGGDAVLPCEERGHGPCPYRRCLRRCPGGACRGVPGGDEGGRGDLGPCAFQDHALLHPLCCVHPGRGGGDLRGRGAFGG
ncbi:unnamed protein product, partial [Ectocarpus sp. 6 AP-2014]